MSEDPLGGGTFNLSATERKLVVGFADLLTELRSKKRGHKEQESQPCESEDIPTSPGQSFTEPDTDQLDSDYESRKSKSAFSDVVLEVMKSNDNKKSEQKQASNRPQTSSTSPQTSADEVNYSKPTTKQRFREAGRKVIAQQKSAADATTETMGNSSIDGEWEPSLTHHEDELKALQELGLGVAIDITAKHPWVAKSAFQAKPVNLKDLVVINESNKFHSSREHVEKYSDVQAGLESSFRPDPSKPINVTVAADFHRSSTRSKTIDSKTLLTRTVAFRARDPANRDQTTEDFEANLHKYLVKEKCFSQCDMPKHYPHPCECKYSATTNHKCIRYLKELGGVTHYVSSVTLGATRYQVHLNSTLFSSASTSSGISADTFVSVSTKTKASRKVFQSHSKEHRIGKIPESLDCSVLQFRTKGEAVVKCSYNSLANLVSHPNLRLQLEMGIREYIDSKKNGTRGPYHIATAELWGCIEQSGAMRQQRHYWSIDWSGTVKSDKNAAAEGGDGSEVVARNKNCFEIKHTPYVEYASNFYLKPIVQSTHGDRYFHIVTDPEDRHSFKERKEDNPSPIHDQQQTQDNTSTAQSGIPRKEDNPDPNQLQPQGNTSTPQSGVQDKPHYYEPTRYVNVKGEHLVVELEARKGCSSFKLKNPQDGVTYSLTKSQWLPEALRGSQPHIICREGTKHRHRIGNQISSIYIKAGEEIDSKLLFGPHKQSSDSYSYFVLEEGHDT